MQVFKDQLVYPHSKDCRGNVTCCDILFFFFLISSMRMFESCISKITLLTVAASIIGKRNLKE